MYWYSKPNKQNLTHFHRYLGTLFQNQMDPKLLNLVLKIIIVAPEKFWLLMFCFWVVLFAKFQRLFLKALNLSIFELENVLFKEVRILIGTIIRVLMRHPQPVIVRHWLKTDPFRQSITSVMVRNLSVIFSKNVFFWSCDQSMFMRNSFQPKIGFNKWMQIES